jgi:hypothetical protein
LLSRLLYGLAQQVLVPVALAFSRVPLLAVSRDGDDRSGQEKSAPDTIGTKPEWALSKWKLSQD